MVVEKDEYKHNSYVLYQKVVGAMERKISQVKNTGGIGG
jgi:hypothetical protein